MPRNNNPETNNRRTIGSIFGAPGSNSSGSPVGSPEQNNTRAIPAIFGLNRPIYTRHPEESAPGWGVAGIGEDPDLARQLAMIRADAQSQLDEYNQRVRDAEAKAAYERALVARQMGITNDTRDLATEYAGQSYNDLINNLQGIVPLTQQAYDQGVANVGQGYAQGIQNLEAPQADAQSLAAQLAAISGSPTAQQEAGSYTQLASQMADLLKGSQTAAVGNLAALGQGDVAAATAALPGYRDEMNQVVSDLDLQSRADLSDLRNELAGIAVNRPYLDLGSLTRNTEERVRQAREAFLQRQEEDQGVGEGLQAAFQFAQQQGNPELANQFLDYLNSSRAGIADPNDPTRTLDESSALAQLIAGYELPSDLYPTRTETYTTTEDNPDWGDRRGMFGETQRIPIVSRGLSAIGGLFGHGGGEHEVTRTRTVQDPRAEAERQRQMRILQNMIDIYYGNY